MRPITKESLIPPLRRPSMYTGEQGQRTREEWLADAIIAYHSGPKGVEV